MPALSWTPDEDATLRKLHAEDMPFKAIAARLEGRTRNSCIGRSKRLGLPGRPNPIKPEAGAQPRYTSPPKPNPVAVSEPLTAIGPIRSFPDKGCKWIVGDTREAWQCCGHPVAAEGASYCEGHAKKAYQPRPVRSHHAADPAVRKAEADSGIKRMFGG